MKIQINRLSPHQNAKVFAILMAISSLLFIIPMVLTFSLISPGVDVKGNPIPQPGLGMFLLFPFIYLVMGYVMVGAGCIIYNFMFKYIGGIEFESSE